MKVLHLKVSLMICQVMQQSRNEGMQMLNMLSSPTSEGGMESDMAQVILS